MSQQTKDFFAFGPFRLDGQKRVLVRDGRPVPLAPKAAEILVMLVEQAGHLVDKAELMKRVWPDAFVEEGNLNKNIFFLRKTLGEWNGGREYIETVPKRGYRFIAPVSEVTHAESAPHPRSAGTANLISKKVSHYRVLEILGGGGMGVVYRAEDIKLGRRVALKFLPEESAKDPAALGRFEREARSASALEHPNICPIYEFGEHEGQPFLVMQLLEGQTLRELISASSEDKPGLELGCVLDFACQITDGLAAAHRQGIIHRDIKPANVFVTSEGQAKILDFGLAKLARLMSGAEEDSDQEPRGRSAEGPSRESGPVPVGTADAFLSLTGIAMGTAGYMSPEQVRGEKLDARTDLFSLGLVLYEMATGKRAFTGDTGPVLQEAILKQVPIPVRKVNPELPAKLEEIIHKALEKDREMRYQSASEMRTDLQSLKREMELPWWAGPQLSVAQRNWKWLMGILIGSLAISVAVGFGTGRWRSRNRGFNLEKMQITKLTQAGNAGPVAISPDGRYVVYGLDSKQGTALWLRQVETHSKVQILPPEAVEYEGLSFSPDGNYVYFVHSGTKNTDFRYLYMMPALGGPVRQLATDVDSPVSFSPDGRQFVYTRGDAKQGDCEVRLANADGSANRVLATIPETWPGFQPGAAWSPDGRTIAVSFQLYGKRSGYALKLVSIRDGRIGELYFSNYPIGRPLWLPEGNDLLVSLGDRTKGGQLWKISYPQGQARRLTNDLADYDTQIDATRNAEIVAAVQFNRAFHVWVASAADLSGGRQITFGDVPIFSVAASSDGKILAARGDGELTIMNADGSQATPVPDAPNANYLAACGRYFLFSSDQPGKAGLTRVDADGSNSAILVAKGMLGSPVCSPDLQSVFYVDWSTPNKIWRVPIEGGSPTLVASGLSVINSRLVISPDGRFLAYAFEESNPEPVNKLAVLPVDGGSPARVLEVPGWTFEGAILRWSPDGKGLQSLVTRDGATNIWELPLTGGDPKQLTKFTSGLIVDFNWFPDDKRLLLARGELNSDVVLISNFR